MQKISTNLWKTILPCCIVEINRTNVIPINKRRGASATMQDDTLWQAILGEVELSISRGSYITWFKNTRVLRSEDNRVVIGVANIFAKQQLEKKYKPLLDELLVKYANEGTVLEFKIHAGISPPSSKRGSSEEAVVITETPKQQTQTSINQPNGSNSVAHSYRQGLNERYTFDSFIVGSNNELAYAACQAIAQNPGTKYNPLFVYGGCWFRENTLNSSCW